MSLPLLEAPLQARPLQGSTALVTGGATGIGAEIGRALAAAGATVAVNHLGQDHDAHALLAAFERDGSPGIAANADLTDPGAVQTMVDLVRAEIGPIDILVNNADSYPRVPWRLHVLPGFGDLDLDEITPPTVRTWRAERLAATVATTVAKSYRLLKAIMETATDDELIRRNPCRIRGAGSEQAKERSTATVAQVDALAEAMGPRWRLMVYFCAYGPVRPEEQAALRRTSVTLAPLAVRITEAAPELNTGRRVEGDTKSAAGVRTVHLPAFLSMEVKRHLDWFAEKEPDGLLFVGEKGAPFRRTSFGRKWAKARAKVGLSKGFRFYDLRHTGHTLSTQSGATLKDTMVRAGQSSEKAAMIYQHSDDERQQEVAGGIDARVRAARVKGAVKRQAKGA